MDLILFLGIERLSIQVLDTMTDIIEIIPIKGIPLIQENDDLPTIITDAITGSGIDVKDGDVIVIAHTIVSKSEGRIVHKSEIAVSSRAGAIAKRNNFDTYQVEIALQESRSILRKERALITELRDGHICNFSGVDHSNAPPDSYVLLPTNSDYSAKSIRTGLQKILNKDIAVIISDTEGRPWRKGAINIAIGCSGIDAFKHNKGKRDLYSRTLQCSLVCQVDQIASAAELVMGQADEAVPAVIVRGYRYDKGKETASDIHRARKENLFL